MATKRLAHASVPSAFLTHEQQGVLDAIALPKALAVLNLPHGHALATAAAVGPPLDMGGFNELVATLLVARQQENLAATALQAAHRGKSERALAKQRKRKKKSRSSGDLEPGVIVDHVSGLGISASGSLALLELRAPSMQLHALSGVFNYPALTSVDVSGNALRTLGAMAALPYLSSLSAASNMLRDGLDFDPPYGGSCLRYVDLRDNVIVNNPSRRRPPPPPPPPTDAAEIERDAAAALLQTACRAEHPELMQPAAEVVEPAAEVVEEPEPWGVARVANHPQLQTLLLDGNRVTSLGGVETLKSLQTLGAHGNAIRDASALRGLASLRTLDLGRNKLGLARRAASPSDGQPTGGGRATSVAVDDGGAAAAAERLSFVPSLGALQSLCLSHNGVTSAVLPFLGGLKGLASLDVAHNALDDAPGLCATLGGADGLRSLDTSGNGGLDAVADLRLRLLHELPLLVALDGGAVSAIEKVAAHNFHGADSRRLEAIRRRHLNAQPPSFSGTADFPGMFYPGLSLPEMPALLTAYKAQYTAAFSRLSALSSE